MKMFYQQFLAFFLMITITLLTLGMTFLGLSRSMFYQNTWDRLQDYAYAVKTPVSYTHLTLPTNSLV